MSKCCDAVYSVHIHVCLQVTGFAQGQAMAQQVCVCVHAW